MGENTRIGTVYLVGAGPGDPLLLTVRGADVLARADVCVYDGLVTTALLEQTPVHCECVYGGKKHAPAGKPLSQLEINRLLVDRAREGKFVVRLKGGDPFLFGRGGEECLALFDAGVPFEVIPGVSSATAVPAYAGIPLTIRGGASTVAFATGHEAAGKPDTDIEWQALARAGTVVLFMAVKTAAECAQSLVAAGMVADTPAAAIYWGTTAAQRTITTTLAELGSETQKAGLKPPALLVVGEVVRLRESLAWREKLPLASRRVLVTRSRKQAFPLVKLISELGGEPLVLPVTQTVAPNKEQQVALHKAIGELRRYDWIVFTSANAVDWFFRAVHECQQDLRALGVAKIAAVGPVTAAALAQRGLRADLVPEGRRNAAQLGQALCAALGSDASRTCVLLPRAAHGRDDVPALLKQAGAKVDVVASYITQAAPPTDGGMATGLARLVAKEIDAVMVYAPSQVAVLHDVLGDQCAAILSSCEVVAAVGNTTAAALRALGVRVDLIPSDPRPQTMVQELAQHLQSRQGGE